MIYSYYKGFRCGIKATEKNDSLCLDGTTPSVTFPKHFNETRNVPLRSNAGLT